MRGLGITPKQRKYAYHIMNDSETKKDAMLKAGYSENMSNQPSRVENSNGFKLAMAGIFAKTGNVSMAMLHEMQARIDAGELKKQDMSKLINFFDVMTRAMERIAPKETKQDDNIIHAFNNVLDITPLEIKDETTATIDTQDEVLHDDTVE